MLNIGVKDLIDIILVATFLFYCYKVMKQSRSVNIFYGVLLFVSSWIVISKILEMKLLGSILDQLVNVGAIGIIVLFQEEIRHFFYSIGTRKRVRRILHLACLNMSKQRVGALIVVQNNLPLNDFVKSGEVVDAKITQRLIENIFFKNSPLHDGAMIVQNHRIAAAACILPISHDLDIPKEFGLRHRAAKGISKETDAIAIVVSEETGNISAAYNDTFKIRLSAENLENILMRGRF